MDRKYIYIFFKFSLETQGEAQKRMPVILDNLLLISSTRLNQSLFSSVISPKNYTLYYIFESVVSIVGFHAAKLSEKLYI